MAHHVVYRQSLVVVVVEGIKRHSLAEVHFVFQIAVEGLRSRKINRSCIVCALQCCTQHVHRHPDTSAHCFVLEDGFDSVLA